MVEVKAELGNLYCEFCWDKGLGSKPEDYFVQPLLEMISKSPAGIEIKRLRKILPDSTKEAVFQRAITILHREFGTESVIRRKSC